MKASFSVIGREGSAEDGDGFIARLWKEADAYFNEVKALAKKDEDGRLAGVWGAMSDFSRSFLPWEDDFSRGLYLAGVEVADGLPAPEGWVKWTIPAQEYVYMEDEGPDTFRTTLGYLQNEGLLLAGAVHDYTCPETGKHDMFFPVRQL